MAKEKGSDHGALLDLIEAELGAVYAQLDELTTREGQLLGARDALKNGHALVLGQRPAPAPKKKAKKHKMIMRRGDWAKIVADNPGTHTPDGLAKLAHTPRASAAQALRNLWRKNKVTRIGRGVYRNA